MKNIITARFASSALLIIFSMVILFHVLVLAGVIPFDMVWGGRLKSKDQMIPFEITSLILNVLMLAVVAIHSGYLKVSINPMIIKAALWFMFVLFLLNTLGNLFSSNELEKMVFTPLTILLSVFSLRLTFK